MNFVLSAITAFILAFNSSWNTGVHNVVNFALGNHRNISSNSLTREPVNSDPNVLGASTSTPDSNDNVTFNLDAIFNKNLTAKQGITIQGDSIFNTLKANSINLGNGTITAANILYGVKSGTGISIGDGQSPTITNTGVTSLGGSTGSLSLAAGTGISVSGLTVTNSDLGSSQYIFKNIAVSGQNTIAAGSNSDTLTFVAGTGVALTTDSTNKKLTISSNNPNIAAGWTNIGSNVYLTTSSDYVGIGTSSPTSALNVVGTSTLSGPVTLGSSASDALTFMGRIANGTSLLPNTDLGSDLGASDKRFNNLWVANINSNSSQSFSGQTTFSYPPTDTTIAQASVLINPTTSAANGQLLGLALAGYQKALIDAEGDIILGYNGATSAPATNYPLTIYGHNATNVAYVDTSGNGYFAGNVGIGTSNPKTALNVYDYGSFDAGRSILKLQDRYYTYYLGGSKTPGAGEFSIGAGGGQLYITSQPGSATYIQNGTVSPIIGFGTLQNGLGGFNANGFMYAATGNEAAYQLNYTTNKSTSGNDTGLKIAKTDTSSPGTSYLIDTQTNGVSKFNILANGGAYFAGNVGVGTTGPDYPVTISGTTGIHTLGGSSWNVAMLMGTSAQSVIYNHGYALDIRNLYSGGGIYLGAGPTGAAANAGPIFATSNTVQFGTQGSAAKFYFDATSGLVGIGTTSPSTTLHVVGTERVQGSGAGPYLTLTSDNNGTYVNSLNAVGSSPLLNLSASNRNYTNSGYIDIYSNSAPSGSLGDISLVAGNYGSMLGKINFNIGGTTNMILTNSGLVGIGTTSPNTQFEVHENNWNSAELIRVSGSYGNAGIGLNTCCSTNGLEIYVGGTGVARFDGTGKGLTIGYNSDSPANGIAVSGNIGIGTTAPAAPLQVTGAYGGNAAAIVNQTLSGDIFDASASGSLKFAINNAGHVGIMGAADPSYVFLVNSGTSYFNGNIYMHQTYAGDGSLNIGGTGTFGTNAVINGGGISYFNGGNVGIGTTSPAAPLQVTGAYGGNAAMIVNQTLSGDIFDASASGTLKFGITNGGNIKSVAGALWQPTSDSTSALNIANSTGTSFVTFDTTNSRVGIGTTSPGYALDVAGTIHSSTGNIYAQGGNVYGTYFKDNAATVGLGPGWQGLTMSSNDGVLFSSTTAVSGTLDTGISRIAAGQIAIGNGTIGNTSGTLIAGNVGIGTTSPGAQLAINSGASRPLDLIGTTYFDNYQPTIRMMYNASGGYTNAISNKFGGGYGNIGFNLASDAAGNTTQVMTLVNNASGGLVGIGTTSPAAPLQVTGAYGGNAAMIVNQTLSGDIFDASASGTLKFGITNGGNIKSVAGALWQPTSDSTTALNIANSAGTSFVTFDTTNSRVGIGTTGPSGPLDVVGGLNQTVRITSTYNVDYYPPLSINNGAANGDAIQFAPGANGSVSKIFTNYVGGPESPLELGTYTNSITNKGQLYLAVSGNVGIGTTAPVSKLDVQGAVTGKALFNLNETGDQALLTASASGTTKLSILHNGLVNATAGGLATYTKAGTIGDTDFTDTAVDGMLGVDSTDSRLYVRSGGAWHYIAFTAGFQIPSNEAYVYNQSTKSFDTTQPLADGDFLIPFVEKHLSDGALHGMYTSFNSVKGLLFASEDQQLASQSSQLDNLKFEISNLKSNLNDQISNVLNIENCDISNSFEIKNCKLKILADSEAQGAVTFDSTATFNGNSVFNAIADFFNNVVFHGNVFFAGHAKFDKDTAGQAVVSTYTNEVDVKFAQAYDVPPVITISLVIPDTNDKTFMDIGSQAAVANVTANGFSIILPSLAVRDFTYNWTAIAVNGMTTTKSTSVIQNILGSQTQATPSAQPSPTPLRPTGFEGQAPVASATPTITIVPTATPTLEITPVASATPTLTVTPSPTPTP